MTSATLAVNKSLIVIGSFAFLFKESLILVSLIFKLIMFSLFNKLFNCVSNDWEQEIVVTQGTKRKEEHNGNRYFNFHFFININFI